MCYRRVVVVLFDCGEQEPVAEVCLIARQADYGSPG
jgi:hypothetical protein